MGVGLEILRRWADRKHWVFHKLVGCFGCLNWGGVGGHRRHRGSWPTVHLTYQSHACKTDKANAAGTKLLHRVTWGQAVLSHSTQGYRKVGASDQRSAGPRSWHTTARFVLHRVFHRSFCWGRGQIQDLSNGYQSTAPQKRKTAARTPVPGWIS